MIERVETIYGAMFLPDTDLGQYVWMLTAKVSPEDADIEIIIDMLSCWQKGVVFDVGCNFGAWTVPLAKHALHVWAFDAQECCTSLLKRSIAENEIQNVTVENKAVGSISGRTVHVPQLDVERDANFGGISLVGANDQPYQSYKTVRTVRLDDYLPSERVTFMKIDVEGGENQVIRGARTMIGRNRPVIFLEYDHPYGDLRDIQELLLGYDYHFTDAASTGNYLCLPI